MKCPSCNGVKFWALPCVAVKIKSTGRMKLDAKFISDTDSIDEIHCEDCGYIIMNDELQEFMEEGE